MKFRLRGFFDLMFNIKLKKVGVKIFRKISYFSSPIGNHLSVVITNHPCKLYRASDYNPLPFSSVRPYFRAFLSIRPYRHTLIRYKTCGSRSIRPYRHTLSGPYSHTLSRPFSHPPVLQKFDFFTNRRIGF